MAGAESHPLAGGLIVTYNGPIPTHSQWLGVQAPTEAVLVSGVNAQTGSYIKVTLTAARVVGLPLNPMNGMLLSFTFVQSGAGAFALTWNAAFKGVTGGTSGATPTQATFPFVYDGTNWNLIGGQPTWV